MTLSVPIHSLSDGKATEYHNENRCPPTYRMDVIPFDKIEYFFRQSM